MSHSKPIQTPRQPDTETNNERKLEAAKYTHRYVGFNDTRGAYRCTCGEHGSRGWVIDHVATHAGDN